jgi:hypothetical protein
MLSCLTQGTQASESGSRFVVKDDSGDQIIQQYRWSWDLRPYVEATEADLDQLRFRLEAERERLALLRREYARACHFIAMHAAGDPDGVREKLHATEASIQNLSYLISKRSLLVAKLNGALESALDREYHQMRQRYLRVRVRPV